MGEGHDDRHGRWRRWCSNRRDSGMAGCSFERRKLSGCERRLGSKSEAAGPTELRSGTFRRRGARSSCRPRHRRRAALTGRSRRSLPSSGRADRNQPHKRPRRSQLRRPPRTERITFWVRAALFKGCHRRAERRMASAQRRPRDGDGDVSRHSGRGARIASRAPLTSAATQTPAACPSRTSASPSKRASTRWVAGNPLQRCAKTLRGDLRLRGRLNGLSRQNVAPAAACEECAGAPGSPDAPASAQGPAWRRNPHGRPPVRAHGFFENGADVPPRGEKATRRDRSAHDGVLLGGRTFPGRPLAASLAAFPRAGMGRSLEAPALSSWSSSSSSGSLPSRTCDRDVRRREAVEGKRVREAGQRGTSRGERGRPVPIRAGPRRWRRRWAH
jgi:hypothetical protein